MSQNKQHNVISDDENEIEARMETQKTKRINDEEEEQRPLKMPKRLLERNQGALLLSSSRKSSSSRTSLSSSSRFPNITSSSRNLHQTTLSRRSREGSLTDLNEPKKQKFMVLADGENERTSKESPGMFFDIFHY
jgi:hypothetical protein